MKTILSVLVATLMFTPAKNVHDFTFTSIDGKEIKLSQFKGKKILLVNTASKCGYTKQYAGLQELSERYGDKLVVIGFPSGNFREQEFEDNAAIAEFCEKNYGVTFLLSEKTEVAGDAISPLFQYLTTVENPDFTGDIGWNFEKFLIDENGDLIHRFRSKVEPLDPILITKL